MVVVGGGGRSGSCTVSGEPQVSGKTKLGWRIPWRAGKGRQEESEGNEDMVRVMMMS